MRWQENRKNGLHRENAVLMRSALKDFPGDALLLVQLQCGEERLAAAHAALEPLVWAVKTHLYTIADAEGRQRVRETAEEIVRMLANIS